MIDYRNALVKFYCPQYDLYVDILDSVIQKMKEYVEYENNQESGGILTGYKVKDINCIVIDDLSVPGCEDVCSKFSFIRKSKKHIRKIILRKDKQSYCIGNWHTHPFTNNPNPSLIDISTWSQELNECRSSFGYQLFIICGIRGFKIWIGKEEYSSIYEIAECEKEGDVYKS